MGTKAEGGTQQSEVTKTAATLSFLFLGMAFLGSVLVVLIVLILLLGTIVLCAIGAIFWPVVIICSVFGCGGGDGSAQVDTDQVATAYQSDGQGTLAEEAVPEEFREPVQDAGTECPRIGPIVIAAQIQRESGFVKDLVGPGGAEGISQLPPDKFEEFGEDDDDSGETSALDAEDSIMAQGRYMCALAEDIAELAAHNEVKGDQLDMTLAAYELGLDEIKKAKGVPDHSRAKSYVMGVRTSFALYSGAVKPPEGEPYPSITPLEGSPYPTNEPPSSPEQ